MTPAELREAVGLAIAAADTPCDFPAWKRRVADAALRVVREAMREPTPAACGALECVLSDQLANVRYTLPTDASAKMICAAIAASPLREE